MQKKKYYGDDLDTLRSIKVNKGDLELWYE